MRHALSLLLLAVAANAAARVLPAGRLGRGDTIPAVQHRANRHFAIVSDGRLVLYDAKEEEEPAVVPVPGVVRSAAVREDETQLAILAQDAGGSLHLSVDRGATWNFVDYIVGNLIPSDYFPDFGGPIVRERFGDLRIGTREFPFVYQDSFGIYAVAATGKRKVLVIRDSQNRPAMIGRSRDGSQMLLIHYGYGGEADPATKLSILALDGTTRTVGTYAENDFLEGWITPSGGVYVASSKNLAYVADGTTTRASATGPETTSFFAVPSGDYAGAWIAQRTAAATTLSFYSPATGLVTQWTDPRAPRIAALHPGASGKSVLIQLDDAQFALWHPGEPPPASYDRMLVPTLVSQAVVHVDPDRLEQGELLVFNSGTPTLGAALTLPPHDEWGTFRTSYAQRLVLPAAARTGGAYGSFWTTDVTIYNASDRNTNVAVRYAPAAGGEQASATIALAPHEVRAFSDILHTLLGLDSGNGALHFAPDAGAVIDVAGRTYTRSAAGTSGFAMDAVDARDALGPTSQATFSGAVLGSGYRTLLALTAMSPHDTAVNVTAAAFSSDGGPPLQFIVPAGGQQRPELDDQMLRIRPGSNTSLFVEPAAGETIAAAFAIDDRTRDPSYFPPDADLATGRIFPVAGHIDGARGSRFRTDLYVLGLTWPYSTVELRATLWDGTKRSALIASGSQSPLTVFRDVFAKLFGGGAGVARLRVVPEAGGAQPAEFRVTARTYSIDANGGTYGFAMPPLSKQQIAAAGETLEVVVAPDPSFRTNLGLVDASSCDDCTLRPRARIELVDHRGATIDAFDAELPAGGGTQIDELFRARGIDESAPLLIRITAVNGTVGAYAAMVDNGTNDVSYFVAKKR